MKLNVYTFYFEWMINVKFNRSYYGLKKNDQALRGGISGTK